MPAEKTLKVIVRISGCPGQTTQEHTFETHEQAIKFAETVALLGYKSITIDETDDVVDEST